MGSIGSVATVARLIGDPARAAILMALMDGRALTAGELSRAAGVTPQTASGHLAQLEDGGLLLRRKQGRHVYFQLASSQVARSVEELQVLSSSLSLSPIRTGPADAALRRARLCYDHLAGEIAVAMADRMVDRGLVDLQPDGGAVTESGLAWLTDLGIQLEPQARGAPLCRACLDWSERRSHIAGKVGATLLDFMLDHAWLRRRSEGRSLEVTGKGRIEFDRRFGIAA